MKFKAVMMDFDGTVTDKGNVTPSEKMIKKLIALAKKMPIAFCTGRQLESFQRRGLSAILKQLPKSEHKEILSNIFLMGENGSIGYYFDKKTDRYKEFYKAKWPSKFINKLKFKKIIVEKIKKFGELINEHRVVIVMRTYDPEETPVEEVYRRSREMLVICQKFFREYDKNYGKYIHLGDSGLGVIVSPADGDKDMGIKQFARFLAEKRGIKFSKKFKEILVIGDSAQKYGNDYYFLRGKYGTPYTVGYYNKKIKYPQPVLKKGKRLLHEAGTLFLLEHNFPF